MYQVHRNCPVCEKAKGEPLHTQRFVLPLGHPLRAGYDIVCCDSCGFVYADVNSNQTELDSYYSNLSKYEDNNTSTGSGSSFYDKLRIKEAVLLISSKLTSHDARIIDIGCANGGLLRELKKFKYERIIGVDPSKNCVEITKRTVNCEAFIGTLSNLPRNIGMFDCVIISHVLEHLYDLNILADALDILLAPEGIVYIEVPDGARYAENLTSPFQEFNTEHINHFSSISLKNLLSRMGFSSISESTRNILVGDGIKYPVLSCIFCRSEKKSAFRIDKELQKGIRLYIIKSQNLLRDLDKKIQEILQNNPEIIIWGTGQLTMKLLSETSLQKANIYCFIDGNPVNQGKILIEKEIFPPSFLQNCPNLPILICTLLHQNEIINSLQTMGWNNKTLTLELS